MDKLLKIIMCLFLAAILAVQILILQKMPPSWNEYVKADRKSKRELLQKMPIIIVYDVKRPIEIKEPVQITGDVTCF